MYRIMYMNYFVGWVSEACALNMTKTNAIFTFFCWILPIGGWNPRFQNFWEPRFVLILSTILRKKIVSPNQFETVFIQPMIWWLKRLFMCSFSYITFLMSSVTCLSNIYEVKSLVSQLVCSSWCFQHIHGLNPSFLDTTIKLLKK